MTLSKGSLFKMRPSFVHLGEVSLRAYTVLYRVLYRVVHVSRVLKSITIPPPHSWYAAHSRPKRDQKYPSITRAAPFP